MLNYQERLDKGADVLMALIKETEAGAAEMCKAGDYAAAEKLHIMAGHMRIAYGIGRGLSVGGVQARGGDK